MADGVGAAPDLERWVACAVALTRLPAVGSEVYYFAQGHAEQWPSLPAPQAPHHPMRACTIQSIECFTAGEQPYARISLRPGNHSEEPSADTRPNADSFVYFPKRLVQGDIQRSYLAVPKLCVDSMLPVLQGRNDSQAIAMSDLNGQAYQFQYKLGENGKHGLSGGWARFLGDRRLGFGDTVLFIRRTADRSFVIEARHQAPVVDPRVPKPLAELEDTSLLAAHGTPFTVTYYPGKGSGSPFVVPRGAVDEAMSKQWDAGMEVLLRPRDVVLQASRGGHGAPVDDVATGTIKEVNPHLVWRNLQIDLDSSGSSSQATNKNMWDVQSMKNQAPSSNKIKLSKDLQLSGDDGQGPSTLTLMGVPVNTT
uniref:Uncharacterized protein n=1 Tax=Avena sativa TaxID=4498 RepID=A0ACD6ACE8_AVESA